jgi:hypothetical protein
MSKWILLVTTTLLVLSSSTFAGEGHAFEVQIDGEQVVEFWDY